MSNYTDNTTQRTIKQAIIAKLLEMTPGTNIMYGGDGGESNSQSKSLKRNLFTDIYIPPNC